MPYSALPYDLLMKPLEVTTLSPLRHEIVQQVTGKTLEVGCGSGVNLGYYNWHKLTSLQLLDLEISPKIREYVPPMPTPITYTSGYVENLPFNDETFDSVLFTLVFCSVAEPLRGFEEIYRVLQPEGSAYFIEHIKPTSDTLNWIFHKLDTPWQRLTDGCHLTRETIDTMQHVFSEVSCAYTKSGVFAYGSAKK